jgi:hypothetical protein
MDQTQTRNFTFTHEGQSVTVPLLPEHERPGLVIRYELDGKPIYTYLIAWNAKTRQQDVIARLVNGEWRCEFEEQEQW